MTQNPIVPAPVEVTLSERGHTYGEYEDHATITQCIKLAMINSKNWEHLPAHLRETLEMVAHKIGRTLNGDPKYLDSVRDCIGYLKLSQTIMERTDGTTDSKVTRIVRAAGVWKDA